MNQYKADEKLEMMQSSQQLHASWNFYELKTFSLAINNVLDGQPEEMFYEGKNSKTFTFRVFGKELFKWSSKFRFEFW